MLLDLTFELWGQKHVIDAGLLQAGDLDWLSNVDDNFAESAGPVQARTLLYQRALSMPAESMLIGNIHAELPSLQESFATEIGSAPLFLGDLRKLTPADQRWYREKTSWFKQLHRVSPLNESFFPLGNWLQPSAANWDGFARFDNHGNGIIVLFRNHAKASSCLVQLPLLPEGSFKVSSIMTNKTFISTHANFSAGISVDWQPENSVEILEVHPAN